MKNNIDAFKTARTPIITFGAVRQPSQWPKADSARCCILEAINIVGLAKYGAEWDGSELAALYWSEQPKAAEAIRVASLRTPAMMRRPPPPPPRSLASIAPPVQKVSIAERLITAEQNWHVIAYRQHESAISHHAAICREQDLWEMNQKAAKRLFGATEWLAQNCRDGILTSYFRLQGGGALNAMSASDWNVDHPIAAFVAKAGYDRWFYNIQPPRQWSVYIFFDRAQIMVETRTFTHAPSLVTGTDLGKLSPYLQFAVKLAILKGYNSPESCDGNAVREAEVREAWNLALPKVPMTKAQVEMIAGIMGFPNVKAIQQGIRGGAKGKTGVSQ